MSSAEGREAVRFEEEKRKKNKAPLCGYPDGGPRNQKTYEVEWQSAQTSPPLTTVTIDRSQAEFKPNVFRSTDPKNPFYYDQMAIQPSEYIMANKLSWCEANVIKYVSRWKAKGGVDDLKKAMKYLEMLIDQESA